MKRVIYVVSRERPEQFAEFQYAFAGKENVEVILDRRRQNRRRHHDPPLEERRRYTRRWRDLSHILSRSGWAVVYQPLLPSARNGQTLAPAREMPARAMSSRHGVLASGRRRVLVVDDDVSILEVLREGLELAGYDVRAAADGRSAERLYHEWAPDVVILDVFLPEQNGLTTLLRLRADFPDAAIIVISGGGGCDRRLDYLTEAQVLGATCTIRKPFGLSDILTAVNEALLTEKVRREGAQPF
jgi:CheY-like chemotaxis protein